MSESQANKRPQDEEIDLLELALKVWGERRWILKCCGYAVIVGLVIAFSIPKEYTAKATIAPEVSDGKSGGGLSSLAAMAGINISTSSGADAIYPDLYPDIVESTPFIIGLFNIPVQDLNGKIDTTLYCYMAEYQRSPWWNMIASAPYKFLGWVVSFFKNKEVKDGEKQLDPFRLTIKESAIAKLLSKRISISVNKKTGLTSLSVTMQDACIAACLADSVMSRLQSYITNYRTNKARQDFEFQKKLFERKKSDYEEAQANYAKFTDSNKNIILQSYRTEQVRLENEMNLAYQVYASVAQQLQIAEAKVQEITPVYTVVEPSMIPIAPSRPSKVLILISTLFLSIMGCISWIFLGRDMVNRLKNSVLL